MDFVGQFTARYRREYDYYDQAARLCAQRIEGSIRAAGIRAIVSARAKNPARLDSKARQRDGKRPYADVDAVYNDIVDLAGVRVALYFPGDRSEVDRLVKANFDLLEEAKIFPASATPSYEKRFSGYWANHYRLRLRDKDLSENEKRYSEARIEVQVASVLMHAWSEVEHDLVYKPFAGELSKDEYAILDELNGLVIAGEIALERLQRAMELRVAVGDRKFSSHYDLAAFLFEVARPILETAPTEAAMGRIDLLFALLKRLDLGRPNNLKEFVQFLHADTEKRPIADQIIDKVIANNEERYAVYSEVRKANGQDKVGLIEDVEATRTREAVGQFIQSWVWFERCVSRKFAVSGINTRRPITSVLEALSALGVTDAALRTEIERIRRLRNNLVHGVDNPDAEMLRASAHRLDEITEVLRVSNEPMESGSETGSSASIP